MDYFHKLNRQPSENSFVHFNTPSSFFKNPQAISQYAERRLERSRSTERKGGLLDRSFSKDSGTIFRIKGKQRISILNMHLRKKFSLNNYCF